jgi:HEAT repeat protein
MHRRLQFVVCFFLGCTGTISCWAQASKSIDSPRHKAWDMLETAAFSKRTVDRSNGIRALGLIRDNNQARELAENALKDQNPDVRKAAAIALGQMHARQSIPELQHALDDRRIPVVMAAAQSLRELNDEKSAYELYYELLVGERKSNDGLIAQQLQTLKNPKELAKIGFSEGIGYIPFAGIGWDAYRTIHKKDENPVRAVAATFLAHDPDPASARALVQATSDRDWIVRAAAVEAIAQRGDASLLPSVEIKFSDRNPKVRYSAAAAVIRLSAIGENKTVTNDR